MKIKVTLAVLFLFACAAVSGAAEDWRRPAPYYYYYYGSAPYEYRPGGYTPAPREQHRYPDYMPGEFGRQPEYAPPPVDYRQPSRQPAYNPSPRGYQHQHQPLPHYEQPSAQQRRQPAYGPSPRERDFRSRKEPPASDSMPYDNARRERYTYNYNSPPPPPRPGETPGYPYSDGFIPYDYAREQYSGYHQPPVYYRQPAVYYGYDETRRLNDPYPYDRHRRYDD